MPEAKQNWVWVVFAITTAIVLMVVSGYLLSWFYNIVVLFGMSLLLTYMLLPIVNVLDSFFTLLKKRLPLLAQYENQSTPILELIQAKHWRKLMPRQRLLSVFIVYISFLSLLFVGVVQLLPQMAIQLAAFTQSLPKTVGKIERELETRWLKFSDAVQQKERLQKESSALDNIVRWSTYQTNDYLKSQFQDHLSDAHHQGQIKHISKIGEPITEEEKRIIRKSAMVKLFSQGIGWLTQVVSTALSHLEILMSSTLAVILYALSGLMLLFYFLLDGPLLTKQFVCRLPQKQQATAQYLLQATHTIFFAFVKGQVLLGIMTGCYMFVVMSIFGVRYALILAAFFTVAEFLPVIGTWLAITPVLFVALTGPDPWVALYVWLCSYGYQTIKDNMIAPKIVGDVMGLHPVVVILSLLICTQVAGFVGILFALPLAGLITVITEVSLHGLPKEAETPVICPVV